MNVRTKHATALTAKSSWGYLLAVLTVPTLALLGVRARTFGSFGSPKHGGSDSKNVAAEGRHASQVELKGMTKITE